MRFTDYFLVIPDVPLMIVIAAIWGPSLFHIVIVVGILLWASTARVIRAQVKSVRERVYVKRSRALGAGHTRLVFRHVLPQVAPLLIANTVLTIAVAVFDETALAFLGLGDPARISLGKMIENAFERAAISTGAWWAIVTPGVVVMLLILSCSLLGTALEDSLNPRLKVAHLSARTFRLAAARRQGQGRGVSALLEIEDLHVWFELPDGGELHAVQGVSVSLDAGGRLGLVGESGCGKTTTALALMGLLPSNASAAGRVLLNGKDLLAGGEETMRPHRWVDVAIVFQGAMNALNPVQTVGSQIVEALEVHGRAPRRSLGRARTAELLEAVGIPASRADRYPHELSGGMRQRASIAMALSCDPSVLIADEPTTALDVMVQAQILELLDGLCRDFGLALLLVTHDLPVVAHLCDRAAVMYAGEIVEWGGVDALYHEPRHPYTRLLFAATPDLHESGIPVSIPGSPPRLDRKLEGCPFQARCDSAFDRCTTERPLLKELGEDRAAACHLNDVSAEVA